LGIAVDANNNVYIAGDFQGNADFNPSSTATNILTAVGTSDMFYAKYDVNGAYVWAKRVGTAANYVSARDIKLDADNNIYVVGVFEANTDFDPSNNIAIVNRGGVFTGFVAKYNSLGNYVWAFGSGGSGSIYDIRMCMDKLKSVYVTGFFDNTCDFDPSVAIANLTSAGSNDVYLAKYDTDGKYKWAKRIGNTDIDGANGIAVDTSFNVFVSGYYTGTVDFDPSAATANLSSVTGTTSAFVAKYTQTGICFPISTTFSVTACNSYTWAEKGNKVYTANNNTDTVHLTTAGGCDSLVTLNLTIKANTSSTTYLNICQSQLPYTINGLTFTQEGKQSVILTNANGCDSLATYILSTVKDGSFDIATVAQPMCDSSFGSITAKSYEYVRVFRGTIDSTDQKQTGILNVTAQPTTSCSLVSTNPGLKVSDIKQRFYESYTLQYYWSYCLCLY